MKKNLIVVIALIISFIMSGCANTLDASPSSKAVVETATESYDNEPAVEVFSTSDMVKEKFANCKLSIPDAYFDTGVEFASVEDAASALKKHFDAAKSDWMLFSYSNEEPDWIVCDYDACYQLNNESLFIADENYIIVRAYQSTLTPDKGTCPDMFDVFQIRYADGNADIIAKFSTNSEWAVLGSSRDTEFKHFAIVTSPSNIENSEAIDYYNSIVYEENSYFDSTDVNSDVVANESQENIEDQVYNALKRKEKLDQVNSMTWDDLGPYVRDFVGYWGDQNNYELALTANNLYRDANGELFGNMGMSREDSTVTIHNLYIGYSVNNTKPNEINSFVRVTVVFDVIDYFNLSLNSYTEEYL